MHQTGTVVFRSLKSFIVTSIAILLFCPVSLMAQDLLVTIRRDTLNCSLGKLKNDRYRLTFVMDEEIIKGFIHKDSILFYKKNAFRGLDDNRLRPWYPLVEMSFDAGGAYQFGKFRIDDDLTDKSEFGARTGLYLGTDLTYYFNKRIGYGLKYNYRSLLGGDIQYQHFGILMAFRFLERKQSHHWFFNFSGGVGWMIQKNAPIQLVLLRPRIEMHARAFSGDVAVGYRFRLSRNVSAHVKASCNIAYPGFVKIMDISKYANPGDKFLEIDGYCHNMNTVNITTGFTFHK